MAIENKKKEVLKNIVSSHVSIGIKDVNCKDVDKGSLRVGITAELDAINLYEQLAGAVENSDVKKMFLDIAKEEKTHVGEFQALLIRLDKEHARELEAGKKEVEEKT
jgi:rubrerythrin